MCVFQEKETEREKIVSFDRTKEECFHRTKPYEFLVVDVQKRQWMASLPYANDPNINPITLLYVNIDHCVLFNMNCCFRFRDERKRRQNEQQQELDELKREVFNLPDNIDYGSFFFLNESA